MCVTSNLDTQFVQKLKSYLQRSVKGIVYKVISNAKREFKLCNPEGAQNNPKLGMLTEKVANGMHGFFLKPVLLKRFTDNVTFLRLNLDFKTVE